MEDVKHMVYATISNTLPTCAKAKSSKQSSIIKKQGVCDIMTCFWNQTKSWFMLKCWTKFQTLCVYLQQCRAHIGASMQMPLIICGLDCPQQVVQ
jgi:hypothetical protein